MSVEGSAKEFHQQNRDPFILRYTRETLETVFRVGNGKHAIPGTGLRTGSITNFPTRGNRRRVPDFFIVEGSDPPEIDAKQSSGTF